MSFFHPGKSIFGKGTSVPCIRRRSFIKGLLETGALSAAASSPLFAQAGKPRADKVTSFKTLFTKETPVMNPVV
jgi:hypothetical protein